MIQCRGDPKPRIRYTMAIFLQAMHDGQLNLTRQSACHTPAGGVQCGRQQHTPNQRTDQQTQFVT